MKTVSTATPSLRKRSMNSLDGMFTAGHCCASLRPGKWKTGVLGFLVVSGVVTGHPALAQTAPIADGVIYRQAEQRQQQLWEEDQSPGFAGLDYQAPELTSAIAPEGVDEKACIARNALGFASVDPAMLHYLDKAARTRGLKQVSTHQWQAGEGKSCLQVGDIIAVSTAAQNSLIADGWITSRVLLDKSADDEQTLKLVVLPGKVANVRENRDEAGRVPHTFAHLRGKTLNLRDIEQGLDNVQRLRSIQASIDIAPAEQEGHSDLIVQWQKTGRPYQFGFLVDDSGSDSLGKYQGTVSAWLDNPLNLNDSLYVGYTRALKPGTRLYDDVGNRHKSASDSYYANYSLAHRDWAFSFSASQNQYDQLVPGFSRVYHYEGENNRLNLDVSRTLYRDQTKKTVLTGGLWWRKNRNFINAAEIGVQRKRSAGWQLGVKQTFLFPQGVLDGELSYQRGTRMLGATASADEVFGEGTTKVSIWRADLDWQMPLFAGKSLWHSDFHLQYADRQLTSLDLINLGGRHTVRGLSENNTISGDSGWYWRNTLDWRYRSGHQIYVGADMGQVWGRSTRYLSDKFIAGAVVGAKGSADFHGNWQYDVFAGVPLAEAEHWREKDDFVFGFSAGYRW